MENTKVGMTLDDVDRLVHDHIVGLGAYPSCINFMRFPKSVCTSVNDVVSHGVPNDYVLRDGDYLNIDVTAYLNGFFGDTSAMVLLGNVHEDIALLCEHTRKAMYSAIDACGPGVPFSRIGEIIQDYAEEKGYFVNEEFGGHGVSTKMHMPPMIFNYKSASYTKAVMMPGMTFTIEPILMMSSRFQYVMWEDNWTVSAPGVPSAQWEHIVHITEKGHEILTLREGEQHP